MNALPWQRFLTLTPLALGAGALLYFCLPTEPHQYSAIMLILAPLLLWSMRHHHANLQCAIMLVLSMAGFVLAGFYSHAQPTEFLDKYYRYSTIEGTIEQVILSDNKYKLMLRDVTSPEIMRKAPLRVRLSVRSLPDGIQAGDTITTKATLFPPSRPSLPYGYDFTRYFYFKHIDAVGYATGKVTFKNSISHKETISLLQPWREAIARTMLAWMEQPSAGVAIALAIGQKDAITKDARDALRDSSLGHMLAISGMHMGIICGVIFGITRFLLCAIPACALRLPVKQCAALVALLCGGFYLALADFPISALRAYGMIAIVLLAVMMNRQADTLRSIVLAACGLLIVQPSAIVDIGFQLSFCATLALVLVYRRLRYFSEGKALYNKHIILRFLLYCAGMGLTSLIAGLVTAPLVAYHFNQVALYGLIANMLALPILTFLVAPLLLMSLVAAPFGMAPWLLDGAGWGLSLIIAIAQKVTSLPHATLHAPPLSGWVVLLVMLAMFMLMTATHWKRAVVCLIVIIALPFYSVMTFTMPDIVVAEDGSAIAVRQNKHWLLLKGTARNFHVVQWQQLLGQDFIPLKDMESLQDWHCTKAGCDGMMRGTHVRVRFDYKVKDPLCLADSDIVISTFYSNRWRCAAAGALRIDRDALERLGAHAITLHPRQLWHSCADSTSRPWQRCL